MRQQGILLICGVLATAANCANDEATNEGLDESTVANGCVDGLDNDGDGDTDCADAQCAPKAACNVEPPQALRVFVTGQRYPADLASAGGGVTGLAGGDNLCQLAADAAALGGQWTAWLSSTEADAYDRITATGPWSLVDGTLAFPNRASLTTTPRVEITIDEHGEMPDPYYEAWTGTALGGRHVPPTGDLESTTCDDWTSVVESEAIKGVVGDIDQRNEMWTNYNDASCSAFSLRLYCFEQ